jgi:hypothetical protein
MPSLNRGQEEAGGCDDVEQSKKKNKVAARADCLKIIFFPRSASSSVVRCSVHL